MYPRSLKDNISQKPLDSKHSNVSLAEPPIEISSDEDDQLMCDIATSNQHTDDEEAMELSSDESLDAYPKATSSKAKLTKASVINSLFNIPKSKVHNVWISSKTDVPTSEVPGGSSPKKLDMRKKMSAPSSETPRAPQHTLTIGGVEVLFPVKPYSCQIALMFKVITGISKKQNCLLESPTGSGKTLALLCGALSWQKKEKARIAALAERAYFEDLREEYEPGGGGGGGSGGGGGGGGCCEDAGLETFARSPFGERSIYDRLRVYERGTGGGGGGEGGGSDGGGGVGGGGGNKRTEPHDGGRGEPGLVRLHKRAKLSGGGGGSGCCGGGREPPAPAERDSPRKGSARAESPEDAALWDELQDSKEPKRAAKVYYGARTHKQIAQVVKEFARTAHLGRVRMTVLSSREYSCVREFDRTVHASKNDMCRDCISTKSKSKNGAVEESSCVFFNNRRRLCGALPPAWDLDEAVRRGRELRSCPYYAARLLADDADIVFCPYNYLLDPAIRDSMNIDVSDDIVILDEAHNIEDVCREAASLNVSRAAILSALTELESQGKFLAGSVAEAVDVLQRALRNWDHWFQNQRGLLRAAGGGEAGAVHTWHGQHFLQTLDSHNLGNKNYDSFASAARQLAAVQRDNFNPVKLYGISGATVALCEALATSLGYLFRNECADVDDFKPTLVSSVTHGDESPADAQGWRSSQYQKRVCSEALSLRMLCMNPAVVFSGLARARCVVLSSGTLTPAATLHSELGSRFPLVLSTPHVIPPERVWVGSLLTDASGAALECTARGADRAATQDGVGRALLWVCGVTPHGVLCFVPSYTLMNKLVARWQETDIWQKLNHTKHVFMESKNVRDHNEVMEEFYSVVGSQRGALLLAVYRGKVSEGMDFKDEQARAVVTVGIPFPNTYESMVSNKMKYNDGHRQRELLPGREWLRVQAYRALNQAVGRCVRHRGDWGAVLLIDSRFQQPYYTEHLSKWLRNFLGDNQHTWNSLVGNPDSLESFMQNMTIRQNEEHD